MNRNSFFRALIGAFVLCLSLFGGHSAYAQQQGKFKLALLEATTQDSSSEYHYKKLLNMYLRDDKALDDNRMVMLLIGYTRQAKYHPVNFSIVEDSLERLYRNGKPEAALQEILRYLKVNPVSFSANMTAAMCYSKLKNQKFYNKYLKRVNRISQAMFVTGSGLSPEDAIYVINQQDIYKLIPLMEVKPLKASDEVKNGYSYKVVEVENAKGQKFNMYFNVSSLVHGMNDRMSEELAAQKTEKGSGTKGGEKPEKKSGKKSRKKSADSGN